MTARYQKTLSQALVAWYRASRRNLPWRAGARGAPSAYAVWVSEVMLQQTQVATVVDYYSRWMRRFPTIKALGSASEQAVLEAWQGLGYYSRARAMRTTAELLVRDHQSRIPSNVDELRRLPGIGPYTAGAIASIAYGVPTPAVDGNVERVLCRLYCLEGDPKRPPLQAALWQRAAELHGSAPPSDLNQALMELGALVCKPREPECTRCPLTSQCEAHKQGRVAELPQKKRYATASAVRAIAAVVERRGKLLMQKPRPGRGRWAGLWQFPSLELGEHDAPLPSLRRYVKERAGLEISPDHPLATIRHSVTRYRITLEAHRCSARGKLADSTRFGWCSRETLEMLALPAPHRKLARRCVQHGR